MLGGSLFGLLAADAGLFGASPEAMPNYLGTLVTPSRKRCGRGKQAFDEGRCWQNVVNERTTKLRESAPKSEGNEYLGI